MRSEKYSTVRRRRVAVTRSAPKLMLVASMLASLIGQAHAESLGLSDMSAMSCELFLRYAGSNAPDYPVFNAFAEGYLAARTSDAKAEGSAPDPTAVMTAVIQHCRDHADDSFAAALASVVKSGFAKK